MLKYQNTNTLATTKSKTPPRNKTKNGSENTLKLKQSDFIQHNDSNGDRRYNLY